MMIFSAFEMESALPVRQRQLRKGNVAPLDKGLACTMTTLDLRLNKNDIATN
jgi:hypothetical protein